LIAFYYQYDVERNCLTRVKMQAEYYNKIAKSVPTSTAAEYLKTVNELRAVTGSTAEAAKRAPQALKIDALLGNTAGTSKSGEFYKLLRSSEMKGISTDAAKRDAFAEEAYKYNTFRHSAPNLPRTISKPWPVAAARLG
jgi:type VI protein secretion system component VasK